MFSSQRVCSKQFIVPPTLGETRKGVRIWGTRVTETQVAMIKHPFDFG